MLIGPNPLARALRGRRLASRYTGAVAERGIYPSFRATSGGMKQLRGSRCMIVRENLGPSNPFTVPFPATFNNVSFDTSASVWGDDRSAGGDGTIHAFVQTGAGLRELTWGGGNPSGTLLNSPLGIPETDPVSDVVIDGATTPGGVAVLIHFYVTYGVSGNPLYFDAQTSSRNETMGDRLSMAASGLTDPNGSLITSNQTGDKVWGPVNIKARTRLPSLLIDGHSRSVGVQDSPDSAGALGSIARSAHAAGIAYTHIGMGGDRFYHRRLGDTQIRRQIAALHSTYGIDLGTNDSVTAGIPASTTLTDITNWTAILNNLVIDKCGFWGTQGPRSMSTDSWTTDANQTLYTGMDQQILVDQGMRASPPAGVTVVDLAATLSDVQDSGKWGVIGTGARTPDGSHANQATNIRIVTDNRIPAYLLARRAA